MVNRKCHVFTPIYIVKKMLDEIGYIDNLYGKSFLENSCGNGQILCEAVKRYIIDCKNHELSDEAIILGLENDFFAIEYDRKNYEQCISNLNDILSSYRLKFIKWNILNTDFLNIKINRKFDFIVGNPPYISYANIDIKNRKYIRNNFECCKKGKFDYCYPFIELSINYLKEDGKLAYLIPTNIFKNVFAKDLRILLLDKITKILDYKTKKIFKNILTSSSIIICKTNSINPYIDYHDISNNQYFVIDKQSLSDKWMFSAKTYTKKILFSDYFLAATSVATLLNEAFVIKDYIEMDNYISAKNILIEKEILKPAASPRGLSKNIQEYIIFPYKYINEKLKKFEIDEFFNKYPGALRYLEKYKTKLSLRDADPASKWFEYGRTQALENLNQNKLLLSFIITNKVRVYELKKDVIPYSGIYIIPKSNLDLSIAKKILESDEFLEYINNIGTYISGKSLRITANDIKNFDISKWRIT